MGQFGRLVHELGGEDAVDFLIDKDVEEVYLHCGGGNGAIFASGGGSRGG